MKALRILKINGLAIVSILLFLISGAFKLISAILEKLGTVLKIILVWFFLVVICEGILSGELVTDIATGFAGVVALFFIGGIFTMIAYLIVHTIVVWSYTLISAAITIVGELADLVSFSCLSTYMKLKTVLQNEYQLLEISGNRTTNAALCIFYTVQKGVEWFLSNLYRKATVGSVLIALILLVVMFVQLNISSNHEHQMSYLQYWLTQPINEKVSFVVANVGVFVVLGLILYNIAAEITSWGKMLCNEVPSAKSINAPQGDVKFKQKKENGVEIETAKAYYQILQKHVTGFSELQQKIASSVERNEDVLLNVKFQDYHADLAGICKDVYDNGVIKIDRLKIHYKKISNLDAKRIEILELAAKLEEKFSKPSATSVYFNGCDTKEKLESRYKQLCKAFHPDSVGGDTDSFQKMKREYDEIKMKLE